MRYAPDLTAVSVPEYLELLKRQNLLPGRRMLLDGIDQNFEAIGRQGVTNLMQLKKQLSTKQKLTAFAEAAGIAAEYLTLLKREIGSLDQKPVPLASFPGIEKATLRELDGRGIRNSQEYYESGGSAADELFCLCDLVRINGVGAVAAKAFYEAGYRSVEAVARADAAAMLERVSKVNDAQGYYRAKLGVKDMQFCIDFASLLIQYGS